MRAQKGLPKCNLKEQYLILKMANFTHVYNIFTQTVTC